jgi:hypothetical protein
MEPTGHNTEPDYITTVFDTAPTVIRVNFPSNVTSHRGLDIGLLVRASISHVKLRDNLIFIVPEIARPHIDQLVEGFNVSVITE